MRFEKKKLSVCAEPAALLSNSYASQSQPFSNHKCRQPLSNLPNQLPSPLEAGQADFSRKRDYLCRMPHELQSTNSENVWKREKTSPSLMSAIRRRGRSPMTRSRMRSAFPWTNGTNTLTRFPKAGRSLPIALDPTKDPAPVWRRNFSTVVTRTSTPFKAASKPGRTRDYR